MANINGRRIVALQILLLEIAPSRWFLMQTLQIHFIARSALGSAFLLLLIQLLQWTSRSKLTWDSFCLTTNSFISFSYDAKWRTRIPPDDSVLRFRTKRLLLPSLGSLDTCSDRSIRGKTNWHHIAQRGNPAYSIYSITPSSTQLDSLDPNHSVKRIEENASNTQFRISQK